MSDFCLRLKAGISENEDMKMIMKKVKDLIHDNKPITHDMLESFKNNFSKETLDRIKEETLEFISCNMSHLPM